MKRILYSVGLGSLFFLLYSCTNTNDTVIATSIEANPSTVFMTSGEEKTLTLTPKPGGSVTWSVADQPSWLNITPSSGVLNGEGTDLLLSVEESAAPVGVNAGIIEIMSSVGLLEIPVSLVVTPEPILSLDQTNVSFDESDTIKYLKISNVGTGTLNFDISGDAEWLSYTLKSGSLEPGTSDSLVLQVERKNLPVGSLNTNLTITSNSESTTVSLPVSMIVPEMATIATSTTAVFFDYFVETQEITITNEGNVAYEFSIGSQNNLVSASPSVGSLGIGQSQTVQLNIIRTDLPTGEFTDVITIANNKEESVAIELSLNHFLEEKWLIAGEVTDAEFSNSTNTIIAVHGNQLRKLDPINKTEVSLTLNLVGTCVSVSPDGTRAAIGHSGYISHVDLTSMTLLNTFPVSVDVFDIVISGNNYAYAFPASGQHVTFKSVNLSNGAEASNSGSSIYHKTRAKLHPSGNYIYGADNGISPSDFEKYDISRGTAAYLYDSPYHGDHQFNGDIWIAEDGLSLFSRGGDIFRSTEDEATDMDYAGTFGSADLIVSLDHSAASNKVGVIFTTGYKFDNIPAQEVDIYNGPYFQYEKSIAIPSYIFPNGSGGGEIVESRAYYGFFNSTGTTFHMVAKDAAENNQFSIISVEVN